MPKVDFKKVGFVAGVVQKKAKAFIPAVTKAIKEATEELKSGYNAASVPPVPKTDADNKE